jgi:hypothetical protein
VQDARTTPPPPPKDEPCDTFGVDPLEEIQGAPSPPSCALTVPLNVTRHTSHITRHSSHVTHAHSDPLPQEMDSVLAG